jgi:replicative DNA helicase
VETAGDGSVDDKELIEQAEKLIFEVTQARHDKQFEIAGVFTQSALEKVESGGIRGTSTHLIDLDYLLGGFQRQDQIIIAARPSQGKTALALSMALNMAAQGSGVGIFSLEMSGEQLGLRLLSMVSRVDSHKIKSGDLTREEWARVSDANSYINSLPIYIDDSSGLNYLEIKSKARRLVALANIEALFVDYMQLVRSPGKVESRNREIGDVSQGLKELAKELNLPVFALSQLSRQSEQRGDKEPQLSDLRDSGEIEQNADVVMFIHRDEYYNPTSENSGVARLLIRKNRNGPVGEVQLSFDKRLTFFGNLAR